MHAGACAPYRRASVPMLPTQSNASGRGFIEALSDGTPHGLLPVPCDQHATGANLTSRCNGHAA